MFLGVLLVASIAYIFYLKSQIKYISKQLEEINMKKSDKKLDITILDKDIETLASNINKNIDIQKQLSIDCINNELAMKETIASISHDLRTPLTSILGYLQLLDENTKLSENQKDKVDIIKKKSNLLLELVNSFFEISVIENDQIEVKFEKINLTNVFSEILLQNLESFKAAQINPVFNISEKSIFIEGDKLILQRIIQNLISNMIKYGSHGAKISLISIEDFAEIVFENKLLKGQDIDVNLIFNKFYIGDKARSTKSVGLGLSIVKSLSEKLNAEVSADIKGDILYLKVKFKQYICN